MFRRLKTHRKLDAIRTRRLPKVWLHVALSVLAMNAAAVVNGRIGLADLRKCVARYENATSRPVAFSPCPRSGRGGLGLLLYLFGRLCQATQAAIV